ncbi:hypothetical protein GCM10011491_10110 [Brucella endophytica]|uniref:Uncharacterized protein n=1 Tax=Brucella endophytica TaxID=1963359 RepID=A0A916S7K2_9HYPH|nr:hypothetical protein [Brucella endophytica]GGA84554.1 hypothetical protein GCM10011491_10110 [Brucella endophytica]
MKARLLLYACLAVSLFFVIIGAMMAMSGAKASVPGMLFFGACAVIFIWQLWPKLLQGETSSIETLLSRYPGPVVIRPAPTKSLAMATGSAIFGSVILWMLLNQPPPILTQVLLWPGVVLFLGGAPLLFAMAIGGASLHLSREGFVVTQLWRRKGTRWHDTSEFVPVVSHTLTKLVAFDDAAVAASRIAYINKKFISHTSALPDTYGFTHDELAALLNAWRAKALKDDAVATQ